MKNSIFKSYSKRILRSEAFISVIVVFVLALGIIGTSYALYMDVDTDTDYQLVEVGDLKIDFDNIDNSTNPEDYSKITLNNMIPMEDELGTTQTDNIFSFRIYNTGTYIVNYNIKLVTADGNFVDSKYINFQLCKDDATHCNDVQTLSDISDSIIREDHISPAKEGEDASVYYFIRIWINNEYPLNTNENKDIVLRVLIEATNVSGNLDNKNTLAGAILNNKNIKINNTTPNITNIATDEEGIYKTKDDYGTSYYFRGTQSNNYVEFNNMCWRIVRIEGDTSVKITLAAQKKCNEITDSDTNTAFIGTGNYGYTYDYVTNSEGKASNDKKYIAEYLNSTEKTTSMKYNLDNWLNNSGIDTTKLKKDVWCLGNTTNAYDLDGKLLTSTVNDLMFSSTSTYYDTYRRLYGKGVTTTATLKCDGSNYETYESYIGTLTADEVVFAGGTVEINNPNYYLTDNATSGWWWTLSPSNFNINEDVAFNVNNIGGISYNSVNDNGNLRPVVSLVPGALINNGDGTKSNPYTIK